MSNLDEQLDNILEDLWQYGFDSNGDFPTEHRSRYACVEEAKQQLLAIIEQYAYEYAKQLVGENCQGGHVECSVKNELRAEQHNRNDQLRGKL